MNQNRRFFLKSSGLALASLGLVGSAPSFLRRVVEAQGLTVAPSGRRKTLITIFQRGAVDGLNMVVPHGESNYYELRPQIAIAQPKRNESVIDLDGFFGLHPSMSPLKRLWDEKRMATAPARPCIARGRFCVIEMARNGVACLSGRACR